MLKLSKILFEQQDLTDELSLEEFLEDIQNKLGVQLTLEKEPEGDDAIYHSFDLFAWIKSPDHPEIDDILISNERGAKEYLIGDLEAEGVKVLLNSNGVDKAAKYLAKLLKTDKVRKTIESEEYLKKLFENLSKEFSEFEFEETWKFRNSREYRFSFADESGNAYTTFDGKIRIKFDSAIVSLQVNSSFENQGGELEYSQLFSKKYDLFDYDLDPQRFATTVRSDFEAALN
jgi:hypothetical protein